MTVIVTPMSKVLAGLCGFIWIHVAVDRANCMVDQSCIGVPRTTCQHLPPAAKDSEFT